MRIRLKGGLEFVLPSASWPAGATQALISIRPEKIHVSKQPVAAENVFIARVEEEVFKGALDHLVLLTEGGARLSVVAANESALLEPIHAGDRVYCGLHASDLVVVQA